MTGRLPEPLERRLETLARAVVNDDAARVVRAPTTDAPGFWFGSGGIARGSDGAYYLAGRFRDHGDSRTGLAAGRRGWKLTVSRAEHPTGDFEEIWAAEKPALGTARGEVVSIEGSALHLRPDGAVELYVSTEKARAYPHAVASAQKSHTGVWDIDVMAAPAFDAFDPDTLEPLVWSDDPETLHVKDPSVSVGPRGETVLIFCHHGFNWSSSSTGLMVRAAGSDQWQAPQYNVMPHGLTWDVAVTRVTTRMAVPKVGALASGPDVSLFFYDGSECVREHPSSRPKGYSCEELGGAAYGLDAAMPSFVRLSRLEPFFVSRHGSGCHRYVQACAADDGLFAVWQMASESGAQPLYGHFLPMDEVERIMA